MKKLMMHTKRTFFSNRILQLLIFLIIPVISGLLVINNSLITILILFVCWLLFFLRNKHEYIYVFLILISTNIGWLFGHSLRYPLSYINFLVLPVILSTLVYKKKIKIDKYDLIIIYFLLLSCTSIFKTSFFDGQPIEKGLKVAAIDFFVMFYFYFRYADIRIEKVINAINIFGFIVSLIIVYASFSRSQYLFDAAFLEPSTRLFIVRFHIGIPLIGFCTIYNFIQYFEKDNKQYLLVFFYYVAIIIFIMQTRIMIFALFFTIVLIYYNKLKKVNYMHIIGGIIILLIVAVQIVDKNTLINKYFSLTKNEITGYSKHLNSYTARKNSHNFFLNELSEHLILGRGEFWGDFEKNETRYRGYNVYISDLGIFSIIYIHGLLGLIWLFIFIKIVFSLRNDKINNQFCYYFFIFCFIAGLTLDFFTDTKNELFTFLIFSIYCRTFNINSQKQIESIEK